MASESLTSDREAELLDRLESTRDYLNETLGAIGAGAVQVSPPSGFTLDEWMAVMNDKVVELNETLERYGRK